MATYIPVTSLPTQFFDGNGDPLVGGTLYFYLAGTTTATDLYTSDGTSIGTSITLNSWGYPESGGVTITLFRDQSKAIKIVAKNAAGATIYTADNIPAVASFDSTSSAKLTAIEALADVTDATNVASAGAYMIDGSAAMTGDLTFDGGSYMRNVATVDAATYDLTETDDILHVTYTGTGTVAISLLTDYLEAGRVITIKDAGGNASTYNITVTGEGGELIDGATSLTISTDYSAVDLYSNGTAWYIH